jgi:TRAP-type mannitol/chloroaromatic compound transport system permease small subunit
MDNIIVGVVVGFLAVIVGAFCALFTGVIVMIAWNAVIPDLFNLQSINYLQGFWLSFLASLLFKTSTSVTTK